MPIRLVGSYCMGRGLSLTTPEVRASTSFSCCMAAQQLQHSETIQSLQQFLSIWYFSRISPRLMHWYLRQAVYEHLPEKCGQWSTCKNKDKDLQPAPATKSVQGTDDTAISIAAAVFLHVTIVFHAVGCTAHNNTGAPESLATQAKGATAAHQAFLKTRRHVSWYW